MWDWHYALSVLPRLLDALQITIAATLCGFLIAAVLGLPLAILRRSRWAPVSAAAGVCTEFVRNTPLLVQVFFLYFVLGIQLSAFAVGSLALGVHYSTYLSEVYRSGIDAVPKGQWEAAKALNFAPGQTWLRIILPQAVPPIIPIMGNYLIVMFKETPILSAITLYELLAAAKTIVSEDFRVFETYTLVGLLFLAISYPASLMVRFLERRLNRQRGR